MADQENVKKWKSCWDSLLIRSDWCSVACVVKGKSGSARSFPPNSWAAVVVHPHFSVSVWHAEQVPDCSKGRVFQLLLYPSADFSASTCGDLVLTDVLKLGRCMGVIWHARQILFSQSSVSWLTSVNESRKMFYFYLHLVAYSTADKLMGVLFQRCLLWFHFPLLVV